MLGIEQLRMVLDRPSICPSALACGKLLKLVGGGDGDGDVS